LLASALPVSLGPNTKIAIQNLGAFLEQLEGFVLVESSPDKFVFKSLSNWRRAGSKISIEMRKGQISTTPPSAPPSGQAWLDVERTALVEVTSEENGYPIESALLGAEDRGWRAVDAGTHTIRLIFTAGPTAPAFITSFLICSSAKDAISPDCRSSSAAKS
jgi:hypothetical protein